jgi:hypothetical protein
MVEVDLDIFTKEPLYKDPRHPQEINLHNMRVLHPV